MMIPLPGPVAYLTGEYPRATDTFIQREVAGLRALGAEVLTTSIRQTDASHHVGDEQRTEFARTFQVQGTAKNPFKLVRAHVRILRRAPGQWFSALGLAARICPPGIKGFFWQIFYFLEAGVLADHMIENGVVHLHNHFGNSSCSVAVIASEMSEIPYSYTMHGPMEFFEPMYWRIDEKVARAAFVACISHYARGQGMIFADQKHWDRMKIVHCGVDPALYNRPSRTPGKTLIFVGRLAAIKGVVLLLEAVAALKAEHPDMRLVLVGDGPEAATLRSKAQELGVADITDFTGYLSQTAVSERLVTSDIFVLPSFAEGVPVVLMEAMAASRPVIAPHVAGVPELVEEGVSGHLVSPGDLDGLVAKIDALLRDPERGAAMGSKGRAKVIGEFDASKEAAWLHELIRRSLNNDLPDRLRPE
ncbi:MAG: glycosyltransferase family 4 protein [Pseudomonadota bacterium]